MIAIIVLPTPLFVIFLTIACLIGMLIMWAGSMYAMHQAYKSEDKRQKQFWSKKTFKEKLG